MNKYFLSVVVLTSFLGIKSIFPTFSFAQAGSLDLTYGTDGMVTTAVGGWGDYARAVTIQPDGKIVVAGFGASTPSGALNFELVRYNIDGTLDNSFDTDGKVITDFGYYNDKGESVIIQSDGKIVVAGYSQEDADHQFSIARYNSDGTLDNTFGTGGKVTTVIGDYNYGYSIAIQPDGKIVVAGDGGINFDANLSDFTIVRYNSDGSLDDSFDSDGIVITDIDGTDDYVRSIAIQSDGKIVVAGETKVLFLFQMALTRYNIDGSLDATFDSDGIVTTDLGTIYGEGAHDVAIQDDNKIVVTGDYFALARYNNDGSLDNTFGIGGIVAVDSELDVAYARSLVLQTDGKIIVAGSSMTLNGNDFALARYNTDGSLDTSFDTDGIVVTNFNGEIPSTDHAFSVALQADGKIVVAGSSDEEDGMNNTHIAVARYINDVLTGIQSSESQSRVAITPNPFTTQLQIITTERSGTIILSDITGKQILFQNINTGENKINTENVLPGIYLVHYFDGTKTENYKVVKL